MRTEEFVDKVSLADLIYLLNELQDPFEGYSPYIQPNTEENLESISDREGVVWLAESLAREGQGRYRYEDKHILCELNAHYIYTFSTKEELVNHIGREHLIELFDEYKGDGTGIVERTMNKYEQPCEIVGFEL